jgi:hypothetical protein
MIVTPVDGVKLPGGRQFTQALPRDPSRAKPAFRILQQPVASCATLQVGNPGTAMPAVGARQEDRVMSHSSIAPVPLVAPDLSAFTKALRKQLVDRFAQGAKAPSHVELLNMLARAAGHRNVQALRARAVPLAPAAPRSSMTPAAAKAALQFDPQGRLLRWPGKYSVQRLALWVLWMRFDARRRYREPEVNQVLKAWHTYGDHATLRRELVNMKLLARHSDCSAYWKEPQQAPGEVRALLQELRRRSRSAAPKAAGA